MDSTQRQELISLINGDDWTKTRSKIMTLPESELIELARDYDFSIRRAIADYAPNAQSNAILLEDPEREIRKIAKRRKRFGYSNGKNVPTFFSLVLHGLLGQ